MGLSMYLTTKKYISGYDLSGESEEAWLCHHVKEVCGLSKISDWKSPSITVTATVAYWRKANQIHRWFVDNIQNGVDDCQEYFASREKLNILIDICTSVLSESIPYSNRVIGEDNVWEYETKRKTLPGFEMSKICAVDPKVAKELLPTSEGFFFGDYNYDEGYVLDLISTIEQLTRVLNHPDDENFDFYYQSSW